MNRKNFLAGLLAASILFPLSSWASGQAASAESGRSSVYGGADSGQFTDPQKLDASMVINDYPFPWDIEKDEDLSVFARLEKNALLPEGGSFSLLVGLAANDRDFFESREGNYIVYINNPAQFLNDEKKAALVSVLSKIRQSMGVSVLALFSPSLGLIPVRSSQEIPGALDRLRTDRKSYAPDAVLSEAWKALETLNGPSRFVWLSGSTLISSPKDREIVDYYVRFYKLHKTGFSYMAYFESSQNTPAADLNTWSGRRQERRRYAALPDWQSINSVLLGLGGSSRLLQNREDLENNLWEDYDRFVHPAVEDIKIHFTMMPWITLGVYDPRYAGITGMNRGLSLGNLSFTAERNIPSMEYGETRLFFSYFSMPAQARLTLDQNFQKWSGGSDDLVPVGVCSVEYYSVRRGTKAYKTFPLSIRYTDDYKAYQNAQDEKVRRYAVLQNTAFILESLGSLASDGNYYNALLLVEQQILFLEDHYRSIESAEDPLALMIAEDIETLKKNRDLLLQLRK